MKRCFSHLFVAGFCLLAILTHCQPAYPATTVCWPDAAPDHTGSVNGPTPLDSEIVAWRSPLSRSYQEVGYARFNLAPIPDDVMFLDVTLHFFVNDSSGHAQYKITPLELDPLVTTDYWVRWDIAADAAYRSPYVSSTDNTIGWHVVNLGFEGVSLLRNGIESGWFGVGFYNRKDGIRVDGWAETNVPYIVVEHCPGPLTYHVDDDAPFDPGPGDPMASDPLEDGSAAHPFDSIQEAIDVLYWDGGAVAETVLVADGTYTGPGNRDITSSVPAVHLRSANGPENCIIDCQGSEAKHHQGFHIQVAGPAMVIEGFTITGGYADQGGAIYCSNHDQGYDAPVIRGNVITGNYASGSGGGICGSWDSAPAIIDNLITGNHTSGGGGGIYCTSGTISGNVVTDNQALGLYCIGGGICASGHVVGNIVSGNICTHEGGGIFIWGNENAVVANNVVTGNRAKRGGGIVDARTLMNCTVVGNEATSFAGGFLANYESVIVDCIIEGNVATTGNEIAFSNNDHQVSYSNIDREANDIHEQSGAVVSWGPGMLDEDSSFITGAGGDNYLNQVSAGQPADSACLDAGSGQADDILMPLGWSMTNGTTSSWTTLAGRTTATNFAGDTGTVDIGFHYPALSTVTSELAASPAAGTLPFGTMISVALRNNYTGQSRRMAARIDMAIADGSSYTSWRAGWSNIAAGSSYTATWAQSIPALPSLLGENIFTIHAWDVTPAPYNQPPYPAAGDSDSDTSTVTGLTP